MVGPWRPVGIPEPEFSYTLWRAADEGRGLMSEAAAEAMRWTWEAVRPPSLVSYIDPANARSAALAARLGAALDPAAEPSEPGIHVYRHHAPAARTEAARCAAAE
jgi:RimJ/RimL family protein N-acetyltransferase